MTRLLMLATLLATTAAAQTPLEALYGSWQVARDTTFTVDGPDGRPLEVTQFYWALGISDGALTELDVSVQGAGTLPDASQVRYPVRADGLTLYLTDSTRAEVQPVGERLRVTWMMREQAVTTVLMDRAELPAVPAALRGDWFTVLTDDAGVGMGLPVHVGERSLSVGEDTRPVLFVDNFMLLPREESIESALDIQTYRVYVVRQDGPAVVLESENDTLRLARPGRATRRGRPARAATP